MKKLIVSALIFLFALTSVFAAKEYIVLGAGSGYNHRTGKPEAGMYFQYQFGAELTNRFSLGGGAFLTTDIPIVSKTYQLTVNATMGPALSVKLSNTTLLTSVFGVDVMVLSGKNGSSAEDKIGYGLGASLSYNYIPLSESDARVKMGFSAGINTSLTFYEDSSSPYFSSRVFVGFILTQPLIAVYYPDISYPPVLYPLRYYHD